MHRTQSPSATAALATLLVAVSILSAAEDRRRYDAGPMTADDFRGEAPDTVIAAAKTSTQFLFDFKYRYKSNAKNTTVTLDSITIDAFVRRDQSWNRDPTNKTLLDHEQGHADIAQIHCLRAKLEFRKKLTKGPNISATASSLKAAIAALDREVRKEMAEVEQANREDDAEYDRETRSGLGPKQAEWRRVQVETIKQLETELGKKR